MKSATETLAFVVILGGLLLIVAHCVACLAVKHAGAAELFDADLKDCRKKPTFEAKEACTDDVLRKWHLLNGPPAPPTSEAGATDAGADQ